MNKTSKLIRIQSMDKYEKFEKFLESVKDTDPVMEMVGDMYSQYRHGQFFKPLVMPNSIRSVTVDPRSGLANKIVTPGIDGMGAPTHQPTSNCTSSTGSTKSNTLTEPMQKNDPRLFKPPKIETNPDKQIKELMEKSPANNVKPMELTKTYSEQVPVCGYSVKTGSTGLTGAYQPGCDAGYSTGGGGGGASSAAAS